MTENNEEEYSGEERRVEPRRLLGDRRKTGESVFSKWVDRLTAAFITWIPAIFIGAVIWGVQLNFAVLNVQEKVGYNTGRIDTIVQQTTDLAKTDIKITTLIEAMMKEITALHNEVMRYHPIKP